MNINNQIVFDYPEFLTKQNYNNNRDVISESSIKDENNQEDFINFSLRCFDNKESNYDNSTINN